jgi:hypothetical protein
MPHFPNDRINPECSVARSSFVPKGVRARRFPPHRSNLRLPYTPNRCSRTTLPTANGGTHKTSIMEQLGTGRGGGGGVARLGAVRLPPAPTTTTTTRVNAAGAADPDRQGRHPGRRGAPGALPRRRPGQSQAAVSGGLGQSMREC